MRQYNHKIFDLPFAFAVRPRSPLSVFAKTPADTGGGPTLRGFVDAMLTFRTMTPLSHFDRIRNKEKVRDFTLLVTYYTHPDHRHDNEYRLELIRKLRENSSLNGVAAFASKTPLPAPYSAYASEFIPLRRLLNMYATSKVAVYVRGLHDCLSFKLGQYLALGMPIAGQHIFLDNHFARSMPNFDAQFNCVSPDDIIRNLNELLNGPPDAASDIESANLEYFNDYISPVRTAEYIVATMKSHAGQ